MTTRSYVQESVEIIPKDLESYYEIMSVIGGGSHYSTANDSTYTATVHTNIYYTEYSGYILSAIYVGIDYIEGGYSLSGANGTTVADGVCYYYQTGRKSTDGNMILTQTGTLNSTDSSWTIYYPSTWIATNAYNMGFVGCSYKLTLQRPSGHTWQTDDCTNWIQI